MQKPPNTLGSKLGAEPETKYQRLTRDLAAMEEDRAVLNLIGSEAGRRGHRLMSDARYYELLALSREPQPQLATVERVMDWWRRLLVSDRRAVVRQSVAELGEHAEAMEYIRGTAHERPGFLDRSSERKPGPRRPLHQRQKTPPNQEG